MMPGRKGGRRDTGVSRQIIIFYAVAATTLLVLGAGAFIASENVARTQALEDSERRTTRLADLVAPLLLPALDGDVTRADELVRTIQNRMRDGDLTEVTVWDITGVVVFSDQQGFDPVVEELPAEARAAITSATTYAAFEDEPELQSGDGYQDTPGFVEVYVPLELAPGRVYAFEAYFDYGRVNQVASSLLGQILPLVFVPLVLMQVIQVPIAASLARRVRRQEADRARLLEVALTLSERERVRIAADLHDGPIQDLAGIGYALGTVIPALPEQHRALAGKIAETVHSAVYSLRRMMVDIHPPDLLASELSETLDELGTPLRARGMVVDVVDRGLPDLDPETITAIYRVAREALLNVANHARATAVTIELSTVPAAELTAARRGADGQLPVTAAVRLLVADDGVGFSEGDLDRRSDGHLGLRLLQDRVHSLGGALSVEAPPGGGTRVSALLPATAPTG